MESSCTAAWNNSNAKAASQPRRSGEQRFREWQAHELHARDVLFACFLLLTFVLYLRQTVPVLCAIGPPCLDEQRQQQPPAPQHWPLLWQLVCGAPNSAVGGWGMAAAASAAAAECAESAFALQPGRTTAVQLRCAAAQAAAALLGKLARLAVLLAQAAATFFCVGILTSDPFHVVIPPLRLAFLALLLLPLPGPNLAAARRRVRQHLSLLRRQAARGSNTASSSAGSSSWLSWYRPCFYWQRPALRQAVIILQRLLPPAVAAASVGAAAAGDGRYYELSALRYWPVFGQYVYLGWTAWMLMLPLRLQLLVSFAEWLLIFSTTLRLWAARSPDSWSSGNLLAHGCVSALCLLVLPSVGVACMERSQRQRYRRLAEQPANANGPRTSVPSKAAAAAGSCSMPSEAAGSSSGGGGSEQAAEALGPEPQAGDALPSTFNTTHITAAAAAGTFAVGASAAPPDGGSSTHHKRSSSFGGVGQHQPRQTSTCSAAVKPAKHRRHRSSGQLLSDIHGSLRLAAAAAAAEAESPAGDSLLSTLPPPPSPQAAVYPAATAGAQHCQPCGPGLQQQQQQLDGLAPALSDLLGAEEAAAIFAAAAAQAASAPAAVVAAAVPYRSLANLFPVSIKVHTQHQQLPVLSPLLHSTISSSLAAASAVGAPYAQPEAVGLSDSSKPAVTAASSRAAPLQLHAVCFPGCVQLLAGIYTVGEGDGGKAGNRIAGESLAASLLREVRSRLTDISGCSDEASGSLPAVHVMAGKAACGFVPAAKAPAMAADLLWCDPACLTAGSSEEQQVTLHLSLNGSGGAAGAAGTGMCCRLLAFTDGAVLADQDMVLPEPPSISICLPLGMSAGLLHLALLPGHKPAAAAAAAGSSAAPALLQPLLVLPAAAAAELQCFAQQTLAAAAAADADATALDAAIAWQCSLDSLTVDLGYVLSVAAGRHSLVERVGLPDEVVAVLAHVCRHLAACGLLHTLRFVALEAAAAASGSSPAHPGAAASTAGAGVAEQLQAQAAAAEGGDDGAAARLADSGVGSAAPSSSPSSSSCCAGSARACQDPPADTAAAAAGTGASTTSSSSSSSLPLAPVPLRQLLCGFADPRLESAFQSSYWCNTGALDSLTAAYNTIMGTSSWFAAPGAAAGTEAASTAIGQVGKGMLLCSASLVFLCNAAVPLAVLGLRWLTMRAVQRARQAAQQRAAQAACSVASGDKGNSSSNSSSSGGGGGGSSTCGAAPAAPAAVADVAALCARAARTRQLLVSLWMLLVILLDVLLGLKKLLVPMLVVKAWSTSGWRMRLICYLGLAVKGWMYSVPFALFVPLMTAEVAANAFCSRSFHLTADEVARRFLPSLLLAVLVSGLQHVQSRRHFLASLQPPPATCVVAN